MRPPGDIQRALRAAWQSGPAPVRVAAERACVGVAAARYTATRMVDRGDLVVLNHARPAVLALPEDAVHAGGPELNMGAVDALLWWVDVAAGLD